MMRKVNQTNEKTPPLPKDKPATYKNKSKASTALGTRKSLHEADASKGKNPQKVREKLEYDPGKKEENP
jgi:hypothetical protein